MSNMSYVRFENTLRDLEDCVEALNELGLNALSESEQRHAKRLILLCKVIADDFDWQKDRQS